MVKRTFRWLSLYSLLSWVCCGHLGKWSGFCLLLTHFVARPLALFPWRMRVSQRQNPHHIENTSGRLGCWRGGSASLGAKLGEGDVAGKHDPAVQPADFEAN